MTTDANDGADASDAPGPSELPDVFADAVSIASTPYGVALTFQLSEPDGSQPAATIRPVARIRLSQELGRALGEALLHTAPATPAGSATSSK